MRIKIMDESRQFDNNVRIGLQKNGGYQPHLTMTFDQAICDYIDWPDQQCLRLQIGTNGHQGMLRLVTSAEPSARFERFSDRAKVDFGPLPHLGKDPKQPKTTVATVFKADSSFVQVNIPTWEETLPNPLVKRSSQKGPKVLFKPYTVIVHDGNELPLYEFQAVLLAPLTKKIGGIFPANVIIERGYQEMGCAPHPAIAYLLPTEMNTMREKLRSIKLDLKGTKETGYSLHLME
jgi:hypothetical protein